MATEGGSCRWQIDALAAVYPMSRVREAHNRALVTKTVLGARNDPMRTNRAPSDLVLLYAQRGVAFYGIVIRLCPYV